MSNAFKAPVYVKKQYGPEAAARAHRRRLSRLLTSTPFDTDAVLTASHALLAFKGLPKRKSFFTRFIRGFVLRYRKRQRRKITAGRNLEHDVRTINNAVEALTARMSRSAFSLEVPVSFDETVKGYLKKWAQAGRKPKRRRLRGGWRGQTRPARKSV